MELKHYSVLLNESIEMLNIKPNGIYVDCTLGGGGHSSEILKRLNTGHLYAFDQDEDAIKLARPRLEALNKPFTIIKSNFVNLKKCLEDENLFRKMLKLKDINILGSREELRRLPEGKLLINTINAHSYNTAQKDVVFAEALTNGDVLIPDGASIVKACRWIKAKSQPKERIAGWDLFVHEMERVNKENEGAKKKVMFLGSSNNVLALIKARAEKDYPNIEVITFSPPYKPVFSDEDNRMMIESINKTKPDLLWIGMTAPKQEKWAYAHWNELNINCHVGTIGAVFDFYAGTMQRAPMWWQEHSLEWLYRLLKEPKRMWRRYLIGNILFLWNIFTKEYRA